MTYLIDPNDVIDYNRSDHDLELFWLFCCVVAGKTATTQARLLDGFLSAHPGDSPFDTLRGLVAEGTMLEAVKASRLGQYNRLSQMFSTSLALDLRNCSVLDLESVHGCGPKTARMFLMMSRPNQRHAALDTHILKHLRENGIDAPKSTPPSGTKYISLEQEFLKLADDSGLTVAEFDLKIWKKYSNASVL